MFFERFHRHPALAERLSTTIFEEFESLVTDALAQRERRLGELPVALNLEWRESLPGSGRYRDAETSNASYYTDIGSIEVRLPPARSIAFPLAPNHIAVRLVLGVSSVRNGQHRRTDLVVPLDGICADELADALRGWGWPNDLAVGMGRAVAIKAHAEGVRELTLSEAPQSAWGPVERLSLYSLSL